MPYLNLSQRVKSLISGGLVCLSIYLYYIATLIGSRAGTYECDRILAGKKPLSCLDHVDFVATTLSVVSLVLFLIAIFFLFRIYFTDSVLKKHLYKFSQIYIPVVLLVSGLGLFPMKLCLGWLGCGNVYFIIPLATIFTAFYIVYVCFKLIVPTKLNIFFRILVYIAISWLLLMFLGNMFTFLQLPN
jgi:hypothetical protein